MCAHSRLTIYGGNATDAYAHLPAPKDTYLSVDDAYVEWYKDVFCLGKHHLQADAFDNWAFIHSAAKDGHIKGLLKMKTSHLEIERIYRVVNLVRIFLYQI